MNRDILAIAGFEPQDDIVGFLRRCDRQKKLGLELSCPYKYNGECDNSERNSLRGDIVCDGNYVQCEDNKRIGGLINE